MSPWFQLTSGLKIHTITKMKVKRVKGAKKIINFYKNSFGIFEPYQVLSKCLFWSLVFPSFVVCSDIFSLKYLWKCDPRACHVFDECLRRNMLTNTKLMSTMLAFTLGSHLQSNTIDWLSNLSSHVTSWRSTWHCLCSSVCFFNTLIRRLNALILRLPQPHRGSNQDRYLGQCSLGICSMHR